MSYVVCQFYIYYFMMLDNKFSRPTSLLTPSAIAAARSVSQESNKSKASTIFSEDDVFSSDDDDDEPSPVIPVRSTTASNTAVKV